MERFSALPRPREYEPAFAACDQVSMVTGGEVLLRLDSVRMLTRATSRPVTPLLRDNTAAHRQCCCLPRSLTTPVPACHLGSKSEDSSDEDASRFGRSLLPPWCTFAALYKQLLVPNGLAPARKVEYLAQAKSSTLAIEASVRESDDRTASLKTQAPAKAEGIKAGLSYRTKVFTQRQASERPARRTSTRLRVRTSAFVDHAQSLTEQASGHLSELCQWLQGLCRCSASSFSIKSPLDQVYALTER